MAFQAGDHVFYPKGGVFYIENIADKTIAGHKINMLDLVSEDKKTRIGIPVANAARVGLRHLTTKDEMESMMDQWVADSSLVETHYKDRKTGFEATRQSGEFKDMGEVAISVHYLQSINKATKEESRIYDQVLERMSAEIQVVLEKSLSAAESYLKEKLDQAVAKAPATT